MQRALTIAARVVAVLGICFISLFALDVFELGVPPAQAIGALLLHLLPSFGLIAVLALAWRWPLAGGLVYLAAAIAPFALLSNPPLVNAMLGGPFALAGLLFIAAALVRPPTPRRPQSPEGSP